ncbi:MAG: 3-deoxy-D-manno-octulosonic acid transferase [Planctomycetota bacterium]
MKSIVFNLIYLLTLALLSPWILIRSLRTGRYREGLRQKLWGLSRSDLVFDSDRPIVWLHGVSVGEVQLLVPLIDALQAVSPNHQFVLSTTTESGMELARRRLGDDRCFYFPLDFSWAVRRSIRVLKPQLIVTGELELWPNLISAAKRASVPMVVVNGRLSVSSHRGYRRLSLITKPMFRKLSAVAAQSDSDAKRFIDCGCKEETIEALGNVKFDNTEVNRQHPNVQRMRRLVGLRDEKIVLAGSTQSPEESASYAAFAKLKEQHTDLKLIVVPRHPDRFDEVSKTLRNELLSGHKLLRRDSLDDKPVAPSDWDVLLVDTVGELQWWWGLADVALVGGTFGNRGGQNMLEPAAYGANVAFGPKTSNFKDIVRLLLDADAATQLPDLDALQPWLESQLSDPAPGIQRGARAKRLVHEHQGATQRCVEMITPYLHATHSKSGDSAANPSSRLSSSERPAA